MAELKSHEVLSQLRFKTYKWNLYGTTNLKTQTKEIRRILDEEGYRTTSSFGGGESGYIYTYYISHSFPFTVEVSLLDGSSLVYEDIEYKQTNSIYTAKIAAGVLTRNINNNWVIFSIQWQESQPKLPSTNLICLTGIFQTDYYEYHLIHPYHYNPQDQLLSNIILFTTAETSQPQLSHTFTLDKNGVIKDPTTRDAFLHEIYSSKDDNGKGMLEIKFSKNENFFNFIEIVYIT